MSGHPYRAFPDRQFWNRAVSGAQWADVLLNQPSKFKLAPSDRVASAGSCFARRIAEHLIAIGHNYELFEPAHPLIADKADDYGYGVFSCRYGNIYTTRQLRQLFDEALGLRPPVFALGRTAPDRFIDLMRPNIFATGFGSAEEARADRLHHLGRVRAMIEQMEVFVFTLGLTEAWADEKANVVYGSHPAVFVEGAKLDHITATNEDYGEVLENMEYVLDLIARHSRAGGARVVLTVSPVALAATHQPSHVVTATTYSKAVLRAAAGRLAATHANVDYFPSYEIFALSPSFGQFLAEDLRDVNPRGVAVAMRVFEDMFVEGAPETARKRPRKPKPPAAAVDTANPADAECDEIANAAFGARA